MARILMFIVTWLETRWVAPAYAGGLLLGLAIAFFGAAINSMAGWLYAMSGVMLAIALINIWASPRSLRDIQVHRQPIRPVSVGEPLRVEIVLENVSTRARVLLQVHDQLPASFGTVPTTAIATLAPHKPHHWSYTCYPQKRGLYHWDNIVLRTAAPLGLFWCRRARSASAHVTVYPPVVALGRCPLMDELGLTSGPRWQAARQAKQATQGLTRAMRPYRWGDPTRLIHWRTSARYGELRVRELEEQTADNQVLIGLDTRDRWSEAAFESAVSAAASLYIYGLQRQIAVALWLPHTGILQNKHTILSALAEVMPHQQGNSTRMPGQSMIWLSPSGAAPRSLPPGSLWVQWLIAKTEAMPSLLSAAVTVDPAEPLAPQLEQDLKPSL